MTGFDSASFVCALRLCFATAAPSAQSNHGITTTPNSTIRKKQKALDAPAGTTKFRSKRQAESRKGSQRQRQCKDKDQDKG